MIHANELRLGNKVQVLNPGTAAMQTCVVLSVMPGEVRLENPSGPNFTAGIEHVFGIPIDVTTVKRCGFFIQSENSKSYYKAPVSIINDSDGWHMTFNEWHIGRNFYFIHQLQNLYFSLCMEELLLND